MGLQLAHRAVRLQATLRQLEDAVPLEQRVEPIKHRRVAQVCIVEEQPRALLHGRDQRAVDPHETAPRAAHDQLGRLPQLTAHRRSAPRQRRSEGTAVRALVGTLVRPGRPGRRRPGRRRPGRRRAPEGWLPYLGWLPGRCLRLHRLHGLRRLGRPCRSVRSVRSIGQHGARVLDAGQQRLELREPIRRPLGLLWGIGEAHLAAAARA